MDAVLMAKHYHILNCQLFENLWGKPGKVFISFHVNFTSKWLKTDQK